MSDDDDDFMMSADEEDYDFDYDDDDDEGPEDLDAENRYYNAKAMKEDDPNGAMEHFNQIVEKEGSEWGYKATKQIIKTLIMHKRFKEVLPYYEKMLGFTSINRNQAEKSLNNILDRMVVCDDLEFLQNAYALTLQALENGGNERLWIKIGLKLLKLYVDREDVANAEATAEKLHGKCEGDSSMGTYLLELYSMEIQLCTITNNNKKLKALYNKTLNVNTAIPHPRILGIIRECGGKMFMRERQWDLAREDFFEGFKNFDEAGSLQRIEVLKYYVLACMLSESKINPFASQETKPYMDHPSIQVMVKLVEAFQSSDITEFNNLMKKSGDELTGDKFMRLFLDDVVRTIRSQGLVGIVKPYSRVSLEYLARHLMVTTEEVHEIAVNLILDNKLPGGRIDNISSHLEFNYEPIEPGAKCSYLPARYSASLADEQQQQEQQSMVNTTSSDNNDEGPALDRGKVLTELISQVHKFHLDVHGGGALSRVAANRQGQEVM